MSAARVAGAALLLSLGCANLPAAEPRLPRDGWVSWEVPATEGAPAWCCWHHRQGPQTACNLDESEGFGTRGDDTTTDTVRVYARSTGGIIDRLQALSASCAVETKIPVQELAGVTPDDSARWLTAQVKQGGAGREGRHSLGEGALAALALHRGELAGRSLAEFARDARVETRKKSVFWLSMLRGAEGAQITRSVMFNDREPEVRKHAAFALSQSKSPQAASELIRQGTTDKVADVRAQAWFWLAQTGAAQAEQAITTALKNDGDAHVREQAVFALSQLPDERATKALIGAAEDQALSREQRKRAVFWLSQSESDAALAYLERVLASN